MSIAPQIASDEALKIAWLDAEKAYRDLSAYRVIVELRQDGWYVDFELLNPRAEGGGAHYVIDVNTGKIAAKTYEQ